MEQKQRLKYGVNTIIIVALLLTLIGWNGSTSIVHAEESSITAAIDDKKLSFNTPPYQKQGTTLVPFRAIFEALNLKVGWNANLQQ